MKFDKIYQLVCEDKLRNELQNNSELSAKSVEKIRTINSLLTNQHKYADFLIRNFYNLPLEINNVITAEIINYAEEHWNELKNKDLQHMTWKDMCKEVSALKHSRKLKNLQLQWKNLLSFAQSDINCDLIESTDRFFVVRPLTYEASHRYGTYCNRNSWCIVEKESYWKDYFSNDATFYFVLFKEIPSDKMSNPWFKTCILAKVFNQLTAWNYFDGESVYPETPSYILDNLGVETNLFQDIRFIKKAAKEKQDIILSQNPRAEYWITNT